LEVSIPQAILQETLFLQHRASTENTGLITAGIGAGGPSRKGLEVVDSGGDQQLEEMGLRFGELTEAEVGN